MFEPLFAAVAFLSRRPHLLSIQQHYWVDVHRGRSLLLAWYVLRSLFTSVDYVSRCEVDALQLGPRHGRIVLL